MPTFKELQHEYDTTRGLWCIDRNPTEVDYEWIKRNAFQLKDNLKESNSVDDNEGIAIGALMLKKGTTPGKLWLIGPAGQGEELDEKVVEDLLKSVF